MNFNKVTLKKELIETIHKVNNQQQGVTTFFDNLIIQEGQPYFTNENNGDLNKNSVLQKALFSLNTTSYKRYSKINDRVTNYFRSDLDGYSRLCSQGVREVFQWKNKPLFKSVYDLAVYQMMLQKIKPATIIEIGSTEGSLYWLSDMVSILDLNSKIIGLDHKHPATVPKEVKFLEGDIKNISNLLSLEFTNSLPRPLLIIEDAHVYLEDLLKHLDCIMKEQDYLVIEDSLIKQSIIMDWSNSIKSTYLIDNYFTDFFGINGTTATNSILIKSG
ncbi:CmcI family methyltransferase [Sutcliffiella horikoshii]|uniref:CmcI family methyltransferase n=1 Tax=Sutcliffiella horikoshii TaxID=79883 RepID=UPI003CE6E611